MASAAVYHLSPVVSTNGSQSPYYVNTTSGMWGTTDLEVDLDDMIRTVLDDDDQDYIIPFTDDYSK